MKYLPLSITHLFFCSKFINTAMSSLGNIPFHVIFIFVVEMIEGLSKIVTNPKTTFECWENPRHLYDEDMLE